MEKGLLESPSANDIEMNNFDGPGSASPNSTQPMMSATDDTYEQTVPTIPKVIKVMSTSSHDVDAETPLPTAVDGPSDTAHRDSEENSMYAGTHMTAGQTQGQEQGQVMPPNVGPAVNASVDDDFDDLR